MTVQETPAATEMVKTPLIDLLQKETPAATPIQTILVPATPAATAPAVPVSGELLLEMATTCLMISIKMCFMPCLPPLLTCGQQCQTPCSLVGPARQ